MKQIPDTESFMIYKNFHTNAARDAIEEVVSTLRDANMETIVAVLLEGIEAEGTFRQKEERWFCSRCYCKDCAYNERRAPEAEYKLVPPDTEMIVDVDKGWEYIGKCGNNALYMRRKKAERE